MCKNCRNCKHYINEICYSRNFTPIVTDNVYAVAEDGSLEEVIRESLGGNFIKKLDNLLTSYKISKVRQESIKKLIEDELPRQLDGAVSRLYQDRLDNATVTNEIKIKNIDNFHCSMWE